MTRIRSGSWLGLVLALALLALGPIVAADQPAPVAAFEPGQILVRVKPHVSPEVVGAALDLAGATVVDEIPSLDLKVLAVSVGQEWRVIKLLEANPAVEYAEPNYIAHAVLHPNDPHYVPPGGED